MNLSLLLRRLTIVAACLIAIAGVATLVRTAAVLRADAAPLVVAPVSPQQVSANLTAELSRAHGLSADLATLSDRAATLKDALSAAGDQMSTDAATAAKLRADLATASSRLTTVRAQLAAAQARLASLVAAANATRAAVAPGQTSAGGEQEGGGDD
jgi:septal ring factor EnvC (AmiA/AmiB activator)